MPSSLRTTVMSCAAFPARAGLVFGLLVAWLLITAASASAQTTPLPSRLYVQAGGEDLAGNRDPVAAGIYVFKGIPYAAPPVGDLRWAPPQLPTPRLGLQEAAAFAPGCFQDSYNTDWYRRVAAAFGAPPSVFNDVPFSEDCLYLNVWTPGKSAGGPLPVMVWLHGGSNKAGWSHEPNYHGARLAAAGPAVVVTVGYRLGVFGFFTPPGLPAEASPNFGLLDQLAALRWVQRNIRAFGGDPRRVTLFGESAGARDIGMLMDSPAARGLFRRAIVQSGGFELADRDTPAMKREAGRALGRALAKASAAAPANLDSPEAFAWARAQPAALVFNTAKQTLPAHEYNPVVDGTTVVSTPATARRGELPYDLLLGFNGNENHMYDKGDQAAFERYLHEWPAPVAGALLARAQQEPDARRGRDVVNTFIDNACSGYLTAAAVQRAGHSAWLYRFTRVREDQNGHKGGQQLLAYHGAEIAYVFGTHDAWLPTTEADRSLTAAMMRYWLNFAATGRPVAPPGSVMAEGETSTLPPWPEFGGGHPEVLVLDASIRAEPAPNFALCQDLADALYPP